MNAISLRAIRRAGLGALTGAALCAAGPALAEPAAPPSQAANPSAEAYAQEGEVFFNAETWRALVEGKTLYYETADGLVGREYYPPGGQDAVFEYAIDKTCYEGVWTEIDGRFCFDYDGTHCFYHLKRGDQIIARQMDGVDQTVVKITDEELSCAADLTS